MKKRTTTSLSTNISGKATEKHKFPMAPSERTILLLKLFARNYHVESELPAGMQGVVLS
ncbi:hypothetical protein [Bacteroides sp. 214]|uniref:hypothetical protein n=1 Tax=Bacteroides sp. 214 TaxID=2302935 RepID=UPI0013D021F6|nr:hypothetical protein [Bacteroides sp. 214]